MSDVIRVDSAGVGEVVSGAVVAARPLPGPRVGIRIRPGVEADFPFIDELQKKHSKAVGFMFAGAIKGHIAKGNVLIAEVPGSTPGILEPQRHGGQGGPSEVMEVGDSGCARTTGGTPIPPQGSAPATEPHNPDPMPVGYLIGVDRYLKRDELGIIYQMNVVPEYQRSLVAANLLKAQFDRSAYGCRLYCCWCAQDLAANRFWEAMGFVPLAFRTGGGRPRNSNSKKQPRMHIFWQKRIRPRKWDEQAGSWVEDDTPYWFPSQTGAGAIGEDRLVLPIPPGTHWSDAKPVVLPNSPGSREEALLLEAKVGALEKAKKGLRKQAPGSTPGSAPGSASGSASGMDKRGEKSKKVPGVKAVAAGGLHFGPRKLSAVEAEAQAREDRAKAEQAAAAIEAELKEAKRAAKRAKKKFDPAQEAFARELKDRWLEEVAARPGLLAPAAARYEVARQIQATANEAPGLMNDERLGLSEAA